MLSKVTLLAKCHVTFVTLISCVLKIQQYSHWFLCVTDLDQVRWLFFESILTTFEASVIFRGSWDSIESWLKPETKPPFAILAFQNLWNALYKARKNFGGNGAENFKFSCIQNMLCHPQSAVNVDDEFLSDALRVNGVDDRVNSRDVLMEHLKMTSHF